MIRSAEELRKKASMYRRWKKEYENYCRMIKDVEDDESKIPSMFPETTMINGKVVAIPKAHGDPNAKVQYRLEQIEYKYTLEEARDDYKRKYEEVDETMALLPNDIREIVEMVYVKRSKILETIADEIGYSKQGLHKHLESRIDKILKERTVYQK